MSVAGSTLGAGSVVTGQRWTTTAQTATLAVLEPRAPPSYLEQARIAQQTKANDRQRGRKGSQVSFDGLSGKGGDAARLTTVNADAMSGGVLGAEAKDLDQEALQRAELKAQLTRTSWTLARNGHQLAYASVGHDLPNFSGAEARGAMRQPARDKKSLQKSEAPYEVMDGYESAATWTTNERARQGKRADATAHAAAAAASGAASRRKAQELKAQLTRSSHAMGDKVLHAYDKRADGRENFAPPGGHKELSYPPKYTRLANFSVSQVVLGDSPTPTWTSNSRATLASGLVQTGSQVLAGLASGGAHCHPGTIEELKSQLTRTSYTLGDDQRFM